MDIAGGARIAVDRTGFASIDSIEDQLRELIGDARLAQAMQLLYTTRLPLKTVAARVGYRSLSSFSRRFCERYGMDPSAIGNH